MMIACYIGFDLDGTKKILVTDRHENYPYVCDIPYDKATWVMLKIKGFAK